jgi:hypothetical protein
MPAYLVLKPCAYVNADGAAVSHTAATPVVAEIPDDVAKGLGDAVRPMVSGPVPDKLAATPFPDAEQAAKRGKRAPDAEPGETDG